MLVGIDMRLIQNLGKFYTNIHQGMIMQFRGTLDVTSGCAMIQSKFYCHHSRICRGFDSWVRRSCKDQWRILKIMSYFGIRHMIPKMCT